MNVLILGGIFLIAFIAIVAAALLAMGERAPEINAGNSAVTNSVAIPAAAADTSAGTGTGGDAGKPVPTIPLTAQAPNTAGRDLSSPASVSSSVTSALSSPDRESFSLAEAQEEPESFNGQFRALSAELRALRTRAREMEQRLNMLMEIVDRIERDQGGLMDIGIDSES
ncbi:MAG TPA: hypothetical protein VKV40_05290 [Ktedonobacteraceae bacterium]|nr:hypothetical protein [Ktedonobacteraceae bacterium]